MKFWTARRWILSFAVLLAGCLGDNRGGGEWKDDPANWKRAFGVDPPADITVIRSQYWLSGHWSHEFVSAFHVASKGDVHALLNKEFKRQTTGSSATSASQTTECGVLPDWFAPKGLANYEVWSGPIHQRAFIDAAKNEAFLLDCQF
jgi:hypothetical protein